MTAVKDSDVYLWVCLHMAK